MPLIRRNRSTCPIKKSPEGDDGVTIGVIAYQSGVTFTRCLFHDNTAP